MTSKLNNNVNQAFEPDTESSGSTDIITITNQPNKHGTWNNSIEFLMSCVAFSVGFGNIWRFPFTAYENGGGAFLIPYIILLILVGKPFYFFEMILGQFTSKSATKIWGFAPALTGTFLN